MARLVCGLVLLVFLHLCSLASSSALQEPGVCRESGNIFILSLSLEESASLTIVRDLRPSIDDNRAEIPVVRNLTELGQDSYGRPGLSHMTIAGAVHHGMKEVLYSLKGFLSSCLIVD